MKKHVLIVDDEKEVRDSLTAVYKSKGYTVTAKGDAMSALEFLKKQNVDVVVTDLYLPNLNGMELLKRIKKKYPRIKVIMMSAMGTESTFERAKKLGAEGFLQKPFALSSAVSILEEGVKREEEITESVLVVDDRSELRTSVAYLLKTKGYKTDAAASAEEALKKAGKKMYDVIVLDVNLPGKKGYEIIPEIKALHPGTKILLMTGEAEDHELEEGLRLGAVTYMRKPFDLTAFLKTLRQVLKKK